ncbi:DUF2486 family protein [Paraburkholderia bryophila]|uniref:Uncharacterized protein n=1 Tax=Paraburkholderia bryophila TaxID=420952 RepID=A0A7Z0B3R3_9BURK|nr:hypothetical protein [Paraburkholderia bryophila]
MSDPHDNSIPVLSEILVPGNPVQARHPSNDAAGPAEHSITEDGAPREPGFRTEPVLEPHAMHAHELAAEQGPAAEPPPLPTLDEVLELGPRGRAGTCAYASAWRGSSSEEAFARASRA